MRSDYRFVFLFFFLLTLPSSLMMGGWWWVFTIITIVSALFSEYLSRF